MTRAARAAVVTATTVTLTTDIADDLARWAEWQAVLATAATDKDIARAREESRSYAASALRRLVAANPLLVPGHSERMEAIERKLVVQ